MKNWDEYLLKSQQFEIMIFNNIEDLQYIVIWLENNSVENILSTDLNENNYLKIKYVGCLNENDMKSTLISSLSEKSNVRPKTVSNLRSFSLVNYEHIESNGLAP